MSPTFAILIMVLSPAAGVLVVKGFQRISRHRYERAVSIRDAKVELYGLKPFRGTREYRYDDQH